ncbi:MAG: hypothetical protein ACRCTA_04645, partial [Bacilli bacterium]
MTYKNEKYGALVERRSYSRINSSLELPQLAEIQTSSFDWLVKEGINEVFKDIYPIISHNDTLVLEFVDYYFEKPKYTLKECKDRDATYAAPLIVKLRLLNNDTGEINEQEVFMGDFPLMSPSGTYIINGAERAIVSQLVRSPGAYYKKDIENGKVNYLGSLIPSRGTWLEFETNLYKNKDKDDEMYLNVRIDRTKKMPITVLLRALGLANNKDIIDFFGSSVILENTIKDKDNVDLISNAYTELIERFYPEREDYSNCAQEGLALIQSIYFNSEVPRLSEMFESFFPSSEIEYLPIQKFINIVGAQAFKTLNDKNARIILNVLEKRFDFLSNILDLDLVDDLRQELLMLLKELKDGKSIRASNNIHLLITVYFENRLDFLIRDKQVKISKELKQLLVDLDSVFGLDKYTKLFNLKTSVDPKHISRLSLERLDDEIKSALSLIEIYEKLKPGEPATLDGAATLLTAKFFDPKRYDLTKAGR